MRTNGTQQPRGTVRTTQDRSRDKQPQYQSKVSDPISQKNPRTTQTIEASKVPRPSSGIKSSQTIPINKKDSYEKPTPPLPPKSKLRQEDLMTQSNIMQARNGLQLLKKKMSQRGMSRDKAPEPEVSAKEQPKLRNTEVPLPKRQTSRNQEQQQSEPPSQKAIRKPPSIERSKPVQKAPPQRPPPPVQEYYNPNEEIAIKPKNVDFEKLIEMQLRAEKNEQPRAIQKPQYRQMDEEEQGDLELIQCSEGCGRSFNKNAIEKHQNICRKVFQNKRKVFNSAAHRKPEDQNGGGIPQYAPPPASKKASQPSSKISSQSIPEKSPSAIPKWKLQSAAFRAGIKTAAGKPLTKQEAAVAQQEKGLLVQCNFCGRRFNNNAAERHIPFCQAKSKMTSTKTMNFKKKK